MEFKISLTEWRDIVETVSAFSNTKSGIIQVGIHDDGKAIGIDVGEKRFEICIDIKCSKKPNVIR